MPEPRPHRCPGPQPFLLRSRREFLQAAGCGFGLLGLADLLGRESRGRARRRAALRKGRASTVEGEAMYFPVHDWRPQPDGSFRPQAALEPA